MLNYTRDLVLKEPTLHRYLFLATLLCLFKYASQSTTDEVANAIANATENELTSLGMLKTICSCFLRFLL